MNIEKFVSSHFFISHWYISLITQFEISCQNWTPMSPIRWTINAPHTILMDVPFTAFWPKQSKLSSHEAGMQDTFFHSSGVFYATLTTLAVYSGGYNVSFTLAADIVIWGVGNGCLQRPAMSAAKWTGTNRSIIPSEKNNWQGRFTLISCLTSGISAKQMCACEKNAQT